jgi:catechol 2,3-dioxygenase-like lactoylglutathione lyase family enzyme
MLGNSRVHPVLLSTDLAETREFYHDKLGLEILVENEHAIEFKCGGGTKLAVTKSTTGTADSQTQLGWEVDDLRSELDELRSRGVTIEEYDLPGLKTEDGIADMGFAWMGWIIDPGKNALSINELKR